VLVRQCACAESPLGFRARTKIRMSRNLVRVSCFCERQTVAEFGYSFVAGARARERERERSLSRARASFSDGDLFVKNEDLVSEDIWRRGDCESGARENAVRELNCDEEGRCW
jgi:hypothetical protein